MRNVNLWCEKSDSDSFQWCLGGGIRGFWLLPMFVSYLADLVKIHRNARTCIFFCIYLHLFYSKNFKDAFVWGSKHLVLIFCSFYLYGQCLWVRHKESWIVGRQASWSGLPCPSPVGLPYPGIESTSLKSHALLASSLSLAPPGS